MNKSILWEKQMEDIYRLAAWLKEGKLKVSGWPTFQLINNKKSFKTYN